MIDNNSINIRVACIYTFITLLNNKRRFISLHTLPAKEQLLNNAKLVELK